MKSKMEDDEICVRVNFECTFKICVSNDVLLKIVQILKSKMADDEICMNVL